MRASKLLAPTLRELPSEAEIPSHKLLLKAGMIRKVAAGIYTYLPLGFQVLRKIMEIVREEMDKAGGQELLLPIIQPAELWQESGRWEVYGEEMFKLQDRHQRFFCLGPTHEEIITMLVRAEVSSYKQLPLMLYQIQNKYRDEKRPRFGLMRGREFVMKDLYSFDRDKAGLEESYRKMYDAYTKIFKRCGLDTRVVEADSGAIGGNTSHEFMALAESGEAEIVFCSKCGYASNVEKAECIPQACETKIPEGKEQVSTPGKKTIEDLSEYLNVAPSGMIKSLFYRFGDKLVCVLIRGDRQINEVKLQRALGHGELELASEEEITEHGLVPGFLGPVGLSGVKVIADREIPLMRRAVVGANVKDFHLVGVAPAQDIEIEQVFDLRQTEDGEPCPKCGGTVDKARGIEVGQIFQLGTKYSEALGAYYADEEGKNEKIQMGCYGIGVSRAMAAAIEQNHDEDGITWPLSIAPLQAVVVPVSDRDERMMQIAESVYHQLQGLGVEVLLDDRDERAGVKFKDADLIGFPYRITVGKKAVENGVVDIKFRRTGEEKSVELKKAAAYVNALVNGVSTEDSD